MSASNKWPAFNWKDAFCLEGQLSEEERQVREGVVGTAAASSEDVDRGGATGDAEI